LRLEKESSLLVDTKPSGELTRTHALLRCDKQLNHGESRGHRKLDFVEQGIGGRQFIKPASSTPAMVARASFDRLLSSAATRAKSNTPIFVIKKDSAKSSWQNYFMKSMNVRDFSIVALI
jgi:hypothetical protein